MLGEKSITRMTGVHPRLISVIGAAATICPIEFQITQGVRSKELQAEYYRMGKSKTLDSKHLIQKDGFGHAVDIHVLINGEINWDLKNYREVAKYVTIASLQLDIPVTWGGAWKNIVDGPHFELKETK